MVGLQTDARVKKLLLLLFDIVVAFPSFGRQWLFGGLPRTETRIYKKILFDACASAGKAGTTYQDPLYKKALAFLEALAFREALVFRKVLALQGTTLSKATS